MRTTERWVDKEPVTATLSRADWQFIFQTLRAKYFEDVYQQQQAHAVAQTVEQILNRRTP